MKLLSLQSKDVIEACSGSKIGYVADVEINIETLCIECLYIERYSTIKLLNLMRGPSRIVVNVKQIVSIGHDVIIVRIEN